MQVYDLIAHQSATNLKDFSVLVSGVLVVGVVVKVVDVAFINEEGEG